MDKPKLGEKLTIWLALTEAIQHIMLKLTMDECLNRHYVRTKLRPNLRGQVFFCVDLTWNDPYTFTFISSKHKKRNVVATRCLFMLVA